MTRWRPRAVLLVSLFVIIDVAIVILAVALSRRGAPSDASADRAAGAGASSSATPADDAPIAGPLTLSASPSGALARVTRGSCDDRNPVRSRVWSSASAGGAMTARTVPGLVESLGVSYGRRTLAIVGADSKCTVRGYTSTDGGATWTQGEVPREVWWVDPDTTSQSVHGPTARGVVDLECTPVAVTTGSDGAQVACGDQGVVRLDESGRTALTQPLVADVVAAVADGPNRTLVLGSTPSCGARLQLVRASGNPRALACLGDNVAPLGLAVSGSRWFVQAGYRLAVSDDRGARFTDYPNDPVTAAGG